MLDNNAMDAFGHAFSTRIESEPLESCPCLTFPEVGENAHAMALIAELVESVVAGYNSVPDADGMLNILKHAFVVGMAFGMGYGALDAISDDTGDYSWGLSDEDLAILARGDFLGDEGDADRL